MCKFIGKSNERILCKLSKSEILKLYSIIHFAIETTKTSNFSCQSKFFISIFFTCQVSACELQPFSCHDLANDIYSQNAKTVSSNLKRLPVNRGSTATVSKFPCLRREVHVIGGHYSEVAGIIERLKQTWIYL